MNKGDITMKKSTIALMFALGLAMPFTAVNAASAEAASDGQATAEKASSSPQAGAADVRQNDTLQKLRKRIVRR